MSQLILGVVGFMLAIRPKAVAELENRPQWKIGFPIAIGIIAITGFLVARQGSAELKDQIRTLYAQATSSATKNDLDSLTAHIDSGFKQVTDVLASFCKPSKPANVPPAQAQIPLPAPPNITFAQTRAVSTNPQFPFALQVTIQSSEQVPVNFGIECTGEIGTMNAFLVGQGIYFSKILGFTDNTRTTATVKFGYPPLAPQSPLIVTLYSKYDIRVKAIRAL